MNDPLAPYDWQGDPDVDVLSGCLRFCFAVALICGVVLVLLFLWVAIVG